MLLNLVEKQSASSMGDLPTCDKISVLVLGILARFVIEVR